MRATDDVCAGAHGVAEGVQCSDGESGAAAVETAPTQSKPRARMLPPYKVLLHNDDVHDMLFVVEKIIELTPLEREEAIQRMLEAHLTGVALLLVTHRERAELYCEQFQTYNLTATYEPDA